MVRLTLVRLPHGCLRLRLLWLLLLLAQAALRGDGRRDDVVLVLGVAVAARGAATAAAAVGVGAGLAAGAAAAPEPAPEGGLLVRLGGVGAGVVRVAVAGTAVMRLDGGAAPVRRNVDGELSAANGHVGRRSRDRVPPGRADVDDGVVAVVVLLLLVVLLVLRGQGEQICVDESAHARIVAARPSSWTLGRSNLELNRRLPQWAWLFGEGRGKGDRSARFGISQLLSTSDTWTPS